jgi:DNA-binding transcriptional MerR regulator
LADTGAPRDPVGDASDWLTLREASEVTGVPAATIRKWVRHENVPSFLEQTNDGYLRIVSMSGIRRWTEKIGREIASTVPGPRPRHRPERSIDLTADHGAAHDPGEPGVPEGSMLVPLDAWNRMLNQLGNLHEAGQQLAEARERAARAETEAHFLRERLADLRAQMEQPRDRDKPTTGSVPSAGGPFSLVGRIYSGWRRRRG